MPFDVQAARAAGYNDAEIVEHLAKGNPQFDLSGARAAGYDDTEILGHLLSGPAPATKTAPTEVTSGPDADILTARRVQRAGERERLGLSSDYSADPADGMGEWQKLGAGFGKAFVDVGRGVRQIGADVADAVAPRAQTLADLAAGRDNSRSAAMTAEVDESRRADAPLMRTGSGVAGNVSGAVGMTAPAMLIPGGASIVGSTLTGGAYGAVQPVGTGESRAENTALGATFGAAGPVAARTIGALWRTGKALTVDPFTAAGRDRIAGRVMNRFGIDPADTAGLTDAPTRTGARLTAAEQIQRPEGAAAAARLQDQIRTANPEAAAKFAARDEANNAARVATMDRLTSGRDAAAKARAQATGGLYKQAGSQQFAATPEFAQLAERPAIKSALAQVQENVANTGAQVAPNSIEMLHEAKLALDSQIAKLRATVPNAAKLREVEAAIKAQRDLVAFIEKQSPDYARARSTYATMSQPVNQADIAEELLRRGSTTTTDLSGNARLTAAGLTKAVADEGKLIKGATGRELGGGELKNVLTKNQLDDINAVVGEVDRAAAVARAANGPGSATAQRLAGSNVLQEAVRGTGLPASIADSTVLQEVLARPISWLVSKVGEPKIQMTLADVLLNPAAANRAMMAANPAQRTALANIMRNKYLTQAARQTLPAMAQANRQ